jgi:CheY-like chemotaxis protein
MPDNAEPRDWPQILVVEDEPLIRLMVVDMLGLLGCAALEAGSGAEALAIVRDPQRRLDALMIDLGLPDQPGEEVVRQVRDLRPDLPVIVTTGSDTALAGRRLSDDGAVSFLEKPYYLKDLEIAVAALSAPR